MNAELQRKGRNKDTIINHAYIESGDYRKKFDYISGDKKLNRLIYDLSKKMLNHCSGTLYEDMYWIDLDTCQVIAKETNSKLEHKVAYSNATKKVIKKYPHILTVQSHPESGPPSAEDLNCNLKFKYELGVVCCHDGRIFTYISNQYVSGLYHNLLVGQYEKLGYSHVDAQIEALKEIQEKYDVVVKEVLL